MNCKFCNKHYKSNAWLITHEMNCKSKDISSESTDDESLNTSTDLFDNAFINDNVNDSIDIYNKYLWSNFLEDCSIKAGFKKASTVFKDNAAIHYFDINISNNMNSPRWYCIISLGSLFFVSTVFANKSELFVSKFSSFEKLDEANGGRNFIQKLQIFFDQKLKQHCENILKRLLKPSCYNFEDAFDAQKIFTENKKYLGESYKKYHEVLTNFSGTAKSIQLEFRHILEDPIEIEITRDEINQLLEGTLAEIQRIILDTKKFLQEKHKDSSCITLLITGNGFKFPGVKDLIKKEFPTNFHQRQVFYDEEIIKGALQAHQF